MEIFYAQKKLGKKINTMLTILLLLLLIPLFLTIFCQKMQLEELLGNVNRTAENRGGCGHAFLHCRKRR